MKEATFNSFLETIRHYGIPFNTVFEITSRCNLSCIHCYQKQVEKELSFQEIRLILDQLKEAGCLKITFTGGEPTLRPDFADIYRDAHERDFAVTVYTNGTLLTDEHIRLLSEKHPLAVECSLHGATAQTHDSITGKAGSFDSTLSNVRRLKEAGVTVLAKTVVMTVNFAELDLMKALTEKLGIPLQKTFRIFASSDPHKSVSQLRLPAEHIRKWAKNNPTDLSLMDGAESWDGDFLCRAGSDSCCIGANGEVYPCTALRVACGNLREQTFEKIWRDSPQLNAWRSVTEADYPLCARCQWKKKCRFCPGMGFMEYGDPTIPSRELCRIAEALWS